MKYLTDMIEELQPEKCAARETISVLDLGCGNGELVWRLNGAGYDAKGCDMKFKAGPHTGELRESGSIALIESDPYRLPFDDERFDVIVSSQVLEHVADYDTTLSESRRILKNGGVAIHRFPSRLRPVESHVYVPFASLFKGYWYLLPWTCLGIRKKNQRGMPCRQVAATNAEYLQTSTNYLTGREIRQKFMNAGFHVSDHGEKVYLRNSPNSRGRALYRIGCCVPLVFWVYRTFWTRVIIAS